MKQSRSSANLKVGGLIPGYSSLCAKVFLGKIMNPELLLVHLSKKVFRHKKGAYVMKHEV